jgi:hypothetical protein
MPPLKVINHSRSARDEAIGLGWLPGARYTNLRDVRTLDAIGFIDINWKRYNFDRHLAAVIATRPRLTVARDIECVSTLDLVLQQAKLLAAYAERVIVVPKDPRLADALNSAIPSEFILGYSVPTRYGASPIPPSKFKRPVHLLGGRPDVQRELARRMVVYSFDCNRFTLDAAFGDYFDGEKFRPHPKGGYRTCIRDSLVNINKLWEDYRGCDSLLR